MCVLDLWFNDNIESDSYHDQHNFGNSSHPQRAWDIGHLFQYPIFLSLHSSSKMVLPIYIALASAVVLFENSIFPIIQLFQPLVTVENFLRLIPRMAGIIQGMVQPKSNIVM